MLSCSRLVARGSNARINTAYDALATAGQSCDGSTRRKIMDVDLGRGESVINKTYKKNLPQKCALLEILTALCAHRLLTGAAEA